MYVARYSAQCGSEANPSSQGAKPALVQPALPAIVVEELEGGTGGNAPKCFFAAYELADVAFEAGGLARLLEHRAVCFLTSCRSGTEESEPLMAWGPKAWEWLDTRIMSLVEAFAKQQETESTRVEGVARNGVGLRAVWPRIGGVISDPSSLRRFLKEREKDSMVNPWKFVLDPVGMLTRGMAEDAEEHVRRMLAILGNHEACCGVVLSDVRLGESRVGESELGTSQFGDSSWSDSQWRDSASKAVALGQGDLTRLGLLRWYQESCPSDLPVILGVDADLPGQVGLVTSG